MLILSSVKSPPPPVAVTEPCAPQVVPSLAYSRQCPASPSPMPAADHVPDLAFVPLEAAAAQSVGKVSDQSSVPLLAAAQLAGCAPVKSLSTASVPMAVSIASNRALRTATESCTAIINPPQKTSCRVVRR